VAGGDDALVFGVDQVPVQGRGVEAELLDGFRVELSQGQRAGVEVGLPERDLAPPMGVCTDVARLEPLSFEKR
jgi:hypothetical protein